MLKSGFCCMWCQEACPAIPRPRLGTAPVTPGPGKEDTAERQPTWDLLQTPPQADYVAAPAAPRDARSSPSSAMLAPIKDTQPLTGAFSVITVSSHLT